MDKSRVEPTIFFIEKNIIFFETFLWSFYGQSFIKTVRGPYVYFHAYLTGSPNKQAYRVSIQEVFKSLFLLKKATENDIFS